MIIPTYYYYYYYFIFAFRSYMVLMHCWILCWQKTSLQWEVVPKLFVYAIMSRKTTGISAFPNTSFTKFICTLKIWWLCVVLSLHSESTIIFVDHSFESWLYWSVFRQKYVYILSNKLIYVGWFFIGLQGILCHPN